MPCSHVENGFTGLSYNDLGTGMKEPFMGLTLNTINKFFEGFSYKHPVTVPDLASGLSGRTQFFPACSARSERATAEIWISSVPA